MASCAANCMKLFNFKSCQLVTNNFLRVTTDFTQIRNYAARRGTRERKLKILRAKKLSKKPEDKKDSKKMKKVLVDHKILRIKEEHKPVCTDDVIIGKYYRWRVYSFAEAIKCHRETHHPSMYNEPNAYVQAHIELDMTAAKKNRFVENFTRLAPISHSFPMGESRKIIFFCKTSQLQKEALEAGADAAGDTALIKEIEKGSLSVKEFDHILAHPNALPDMVPIRGLMRKVFPSVRAGTLGVDMNAMVTKFRNGIKYSARRDEHEQDYGLILANFGKLDMETDHLQDNLQSLLRDIYSVRPKRPGPFITRVCVCSPPSVEKLKLDLNVLLPEQTEEEVEDSDEEEEAVGR